MRPDLRPLITQADRDVIRSILLKHAGHESAPMLERELRRAKVLHDDDLPEDVVTLHSRASVLEEYSGKKSDVTVVPPKLALPRAGYHSVLEPMGASVLGLSEGESFEWRSPHGPRKRYKVVSVNFQPEAENRNCVAS